MKKKKFNLLLNIATICLCVAAIAFGVYSAKNTSLNVSGTIGFSAHDCLVTISGKYKAYTADNLATRTETAIAETKVGGSAKSDYEKTLPINKTLYFSDLATDNNGHEIVFELTITNNSAFEIKVKAPTPTLTTSAGVEITTVTSATSNASFTLDKDATKTIILTFTLSDVENAESIDPTSRFNINLSFEKWSQFTFLPIVETLVDSSGNDQKQPAVNKLCITMGHSIVGETATETGTDGLTETPLVWYAFAVKGEGDAYTRPSFVPSSNVSITTGTGEKWYSLYNVDMSTVNYKGYTYWFIKQYVVAGGYKLNDSSSSDQGGILFNPSSGENLNNTYAQVGNNKKSTIYTYLESEYETKTGVTAEEPSGIELRVVNEKYKVNKNYVNTTTEGDKYYLACQFTSKYWLLNHEELGLLCNQTIGLSDYGYKYKAYGISNQDGDSRGYGAPWWLRSPDAGSCDFALCVSSYDYFTYLSVFNPSVGVRAAFQIQI